MACLASQIRLLSTLEAYLSAERANEIAPGNRAQEQKADQLHAALTHLCVACGFEPGREHRHLSVVEFAIHRALVLRRMFPNNLNEAGL
jgi:hypothetical protein